jgi:hypothetical protein
MMALGADGATIATGKATSTEALRFDTLARRARRDVLAVVEPDNCNDNKEL